MCTLQLVRAKFRFRLLGRKYNLGILHLWRSEETVLKCFGKVRREVVKAVYRT